MTYTIEKGIPVPSGIRKSKHPFHDMEVGDSVFYAGKTTGYVSGQTQHVRRKLGFKFVCRSVDGGTRIWRVA